MQLLRTTSPVFRYTIVGNSMYPAYKDGEEVLVCRIAYYLSRPSTGHAVILKDPRNGRKLIKRIVKKEHGRFFVQGDNKDESTDSRVFGTITRFDILGKVFLRLS